MPLGHGVPLDKTLTGMPSFNPPTPGVAPTAIYRNDVTLTGMPTFEPTSPSIQGAFRGDSTLLGLPVLDSPLAAPPPSTILPGPAPEGPAPPAPGASSSLSGTLLGVPVPAVYPARPGLRRDVPPAGPATSLDAKLQADVESQASSSRRGRRRRVTTRHEEGSVPVPLTRISSPDLSREVGGVGASPTALVPQRIVEVAQAGMQSQNVDASGGVRRAPGSMIAIDQFRVVERLAQGGTGSVYLATRAEDEQYALKVLRRENLGNEESQESLRREAELLSSLHHPNVVRLLEVGTASGEPFLVMEFIDGSSLSDLLSHPVPLPRVVGVTIIRDALLALAYIHGVERPGNVRGIIHGDVSPQNLLVGTDGRARLIDFGVAREPGLPARDSVVRCKPRYASPELLAGEPLGAESDLFAVGAVLFQVLTGRKLFSATDQVELIEQVTTAEIRPPSTVNDQSPLAFDALLLRALERDRTKRFQDAGSMLAALEQAAAASGMQLDPRQVAEWVRRVQRSLIEDVELQAEEVAALVGNSRHGAVANRRGARRSVSPLTETMAHGSAFDDGSEDYGLLARLPPQWRLALGVAAVVVAVFVIAFALVAPETFVRVISGD